MKTVVGIDYQVKNCLPESVVDISKVREKYKKVVI
jgi:hypothetical protein